MTSPRPALLLVLLAGCSGAEPTVIGTTTSDTGAADTFVVDAAVADTAVAADTGRRDTGPRDVGDDAIETGPMPLECLTDPFGPSTGTLVDFFYQLQTGTCESSACSDFILFNPSCEMTLQVADVKYTATLDAKDCSTFTKWVSSDLLIGYLKDLTTCYYGTAGPLGASYEATTVTLAEGVVQKKTWACVDEPFGNHRRCLNTLRGKYFPGK